MKNKIIVLILSIIAIINFCACTHTLKDKTEQANCYKMKSGSWNAKYTKLDNVKIEFFTSNLTSTSQYGDKLAISVEEDGKSDNVYYVKVIDCDSSNIKLDGDIELEKGDKISITHAEVDQDSLDKFPSPPVLYVSKDNIKLVEKKEETSKLNNDANNTKSSNSSYKARFGTFIEGNINQNILVVKFKIQPSTSNKTTIHQNGYNIEDMILNQGADQYDEIQYWAVADMEDGSESKVISFTVDKDLITKIKNQQVVGNQIVDCAKDVWILPSLKQ